MNETSSSGDNSVLVVAVEPEDTDILRHILGPAFSDTIFFADDYETALSAFIGHHPAALVLAFSEIDKAQQFYLELFRTTDNTARHIPHQTLLLCHSTETDKAYRLCKNNVFDDYVVFYPLHDPNHLKLSIDHALVRNQMHITATNSAPLLRDTHTGLNKMSDYVSSSMNEVKGLGKSASDLSKQLAQLISQELDSLNELIVERKFDGAIKLVSESQVVRYLDAVRVRLEKTATETADMDALQTWFETFEREAQRHIEDLQERIRTISPVSILVVEDDEFVQRVYRHVLKKAGYVVFIAGDSRTALRHLNQQLPDLILMDIMLPDIDGIKTTKRIKEIPQFKEIPIVIASGQAEKSKVREGIKAGACDFIVKPVEEQLLLDKLQKHLRRA